ncbi:AAA family ATPase [Desulfurobacterium sp. TC5-1]|uniref:ATP-dependent nuclease n=1 Tax=Desulfurobacterium sp. TC5-1 TaxID=1158318 RepID=UPI0003B5900A|nr:AAA family ATPase [Desulfurobacterium sp. TC5-1]
MKFVKVNIKRFRSINNLTVEFKEGKPLIICGSNNVGKTNFLRALDLYFSLDKKKFNTRDDIPYDIERGKRGAGYNTSITGWFIDNENKRYEIKTIFKRTKVKGNILEIKAKRNNTNISEPEARNIIKRFRFLFIEASNINMPQIIAEIIDEEVLPLGLDPLRRKQTEPLKILENFVTKSKEALSGIEKEISKNLNEFIEGVTGIDKDEWKVKILFAEINKLREVLANMIEFTLYDKNNSKMEAKGSGIQRIVLLSLIKYISEKIKNKNIIWGIDEPEAFLQPALQKRVFNILLDMAKKQHIIFTTHSQYFIDITDLQTTYLFKANYEKKDFKRRPGEVFFKINTFIEEKQSDYQKLIEIKEHFGMKKNDNWEIMPYNILVEGEEDKLYIEMLARKFGFSVPNILVAGGVTKIKGYLQFLKEFCRESGFKPKIVCIFDHDKEGKETYDKIIPDKYRNFLDLDLRFIPRCDGDKSIEYDYEIEDFIYPEIMLEAVNDFLKRRNYKAISKTELKKRFQSAYDKTCILNFFTQIAKAKNSDKEEINFEDEGIKKYLCKKSCENITKSKLEEFDSEYHQVREFLRNLCSGENYD